MNEHDTQVRPSRECFEEAGDHVQEPDQQQHIQLRQLHNERIRLLILGLGMLVLLVGFLLVLIARTVLPLFVVMIVVYLGYRRVDAWLDAHAQHRH